MNRRDVLTACVWGVGAAAAGISLARPARGATFEEMMAAVRAGLITPNEARAMIGLNPLPDLDLKLLEHLKTQGKEIGGIFTQAEADVTQFHGIAWLPESALRDCFGAANS